MAWFKKDYRTEAQKAFDEIVFVSPDPDTVWWAKLGIIILVVFGLLTSMIISISGHGLFVGLCAIVGLWTILIPITKWLEDFKVYKKSSW